MEAFEYAVEQGCHMLELDVHLTKDKVVVVAHDENLGRLCGVNAKISDFLYEDLPPLLDEIELHFSDGEKFRSETTNHRIPKLSELFERLPNTLMHIDLKDDHPDLPLEASKIVNQFDREHITILGGMKQIKQNKYKKLNPKALTFCSIGGYFGVFMLYIFGLLPFWPIYFDSFSVGKRTVEIARILQKPNLPRKWIFRIAIGVLRFFDFISKPLFRHLQKRGILVIWWVLNDPKDFKEALEKQVNGIMTDVPSVCKKYLDEESRYLTFSNSNTPLLAGKSNIK